MDTAQAAHQILRSDVEPNVTGFDPPSLVAWLSFEKEPMTVTGVRTASERHPKLGFLQNQLGKKLCGSGVFHLQFTDARSVQSEQRVRLVYVQKALTPLA